MASPRDADYPRQHPHCNWPMCDQVLAWLREITTDPRYEVCTTPGGKAALDRFLHMPAQWTYGVLRGSWMWPGQERRAWRLIQRIRRGEVRLRRTGVRTAEYVICTPGRPPVHVSERTTWAIQPGGRLTRVPEPVEPPKLPSVKGLFDRARGRS